MTERWRKKLEGIDQVGPSDDVYERAKAGPTHPEAQSPMQRTSTRVATAIAAFVVFALAISLFAIPTLRLHDDSSALSAGGQLLPLWPARTVEQVQTLQDEADAGQAGWAFDPQQVATRFGQAVMGWPDAWAGPVTSAGGCSVASGSYPSGSYAAGAVAGGCPAAGSEDYGPTAYPPAGTCDPSMPMCGGFSSQPGSTNSTTGQFITFQLSPCDPTTTCNLASILETVELFQPLGAGAGNVWSVLQANSSLIDLAVSPGQTVSNGSSLSTGLRIPPDEQLGFGLHVGASDSCRQGVATDVFHSPGSPNDAVTAARSELGVNLGSRDGTSCAQEEPGYVFVATGGKPIVLGGVAFDPLQPGGPTLYSLSAVPITFEWPDEAAPSAPPTSTMSTAWTTYTDALGWTIDVPRDWVRKKIDGSDARQAYDGAAFGSSTPDQQPGGPTTIGASPGEVALLLYHAEGGLPVPPTNDTGPPTSLGDLGIVQGGYQLDFTADGLPFSLSIRVGGDAPTAEQLTILQEMVSSISFVPWRAGDQRNGWTALEKTKADVQWEQLGGSRVIVLSVEGTTVMLGPVVCNEGGTVVTSWQPSATCPDNTDLATWDISGRPAPGNAPGYQEVLPVHPVVRAWDGTLLSSLDLTT
ncbi:MAG: hypothetical protein M3P43_03470 [Actinomycetota bacterium]|nr:hypothetical protein [Actinomycetota bacterium]